MGFKLAYSYKEACIYALLLLLIFCANIFINYKDYEDFKLSKHRLLKNALVLKSYIKSKNNRTYRVLKLRYKDFSFYTSTKAKSSWKLNDIINLRIITSDISFKDYLAKSFYAPSYALKLKGQESSLIKDFFLNQHKAAKIKELYGALYFANPISKELRESIVSFGVAHLLAISGYHLGLIFAIFYFILKYPYSYFQARFFPYRNAQFDLSLLIFSLLFAYAGLLGFVPSFIRALIMAIFGFLLLLRNIKLLSFSNLFFCILISLAFFPQLLFSLGFFFSILGVFFIFLYFHHFQIHIYRDIFSLNCFVFLAMVVPVHYFFSELALSQFLALILNLVFIIFYPLSLFLHLIQAGGLFDFALLKALSYKVELLAVKTPAWAFYSYLFTCLLAIFNKYLSLFLCLIGLLFYLYLLN